jgi:PAS domain S-box-containing protein
MLVPALVGPFLVGGLLDWAARFGWFTADFQLAVFTVAMIPLSGTLVWVIGASLRHVDLRRAGAEDALGQVDRALADRERALGSLRHSEDRIRRIIDTARDAFVSIDEDGLVVGWNRVAEETFGWLAQEAVAHPLDELIIPPAHRSAHREGLARMPAGGTSSILDRTLELTALRRDGSEFPVELTVRAIHDDGRPTFQRVSSRHLGSQLAWKLDDGFTLTWRDVTDRETALAAVRSNEERFRATVEHLHEALSVFAAVRDDSGDIVDFRWEFANLAASIITEYSPSELAGANPDGSATTPRPERDARHLSQYRRDR